MRRLAVPLGLLLIVAGLIVRELSPLAILNGLASRAGISVYRDVAYASGSDHVLDIYAPMQPCDGAPVVVFFYGGGWETGSRDMYPFVGAALAARGIVTVIPEYRLYPKVHFPAFMQDAAAAVSWTRAHIGQYGGDPKHLFLMGHSAGAHIATLLVLDGSYLSADGIDTRDISGVIGLAGPYDFLPSQRPSLRAIFGPAADWPRSQPINFVTAEAPPMLLAAGSHDRTVDPGNTRRLAERLRQAGAAVEEHVYYPGFGHRLLIGAFAPVLSFLSPVRRDTVRFIAAHTGAACLTEVE